MSSTPKTDAQPPVDTQPDTPKASAASARLFLGFAPEIFASIVGHLRSDLPVRPRLDRFIHSDRETYTAAESSLALVDARFDHLIKEEHESMTKQLKVGCLDMTHQEITALLTESNGKDTGENQSSGDTSDGIMKSMFAKGVNVLRVTERCAPDEKAIGATLRDLIDWMSEQPTAPLPDLENIIWLDDPDHDHGYLTASFDEQYIEWLTERKIAYHVAYRDITSLTGALPPEVHVHMRHDGQSVDWVPRLIRPTWKSPESTVWIHPAAQFNDFASWPSEATAESLDKFIQNLGSASTAPGTVMHRKIVFDFDANAPVEDTIVKAFTEQRGDRSDLQSDLRRKGYHLAVSIGGETVLHEAGCERCKPPVPEGALKV